MIQFKKMMKNKIYYSLKDLAIKKEKVNSTTWNNTNPTNYYTPVEITANMGWNLTMAEADILNSEEFNKLWSEYILPKNLNEDIAITDLYSKLIKDGEYIINDMNYIFGEWLRLFINKVIQTYPRYKPLITFYKLNEDHLLDKIKTSSISAFNDTPQIAQGGVSSDPYTTNLTKNEMEVDGTSIINRLDEIRSKWYNLYIEWCSEFDSLFLEEIEYD